MAGALAERVFVEKIAGVGFSGIETLDRRPFGLEDAARYPLFTPDLVELMRELLSPQQQAEVAVAVTVSARKPRERTGTRADGHHSVVRAGRPHDGGVPARVQTRRVAPES